MRSDRYQYKLIYQAVENIKHLTANDLPVVHFIDTLIAESLSKNASDLHFEPYENHYRIRVRIDGLLYEVMQTSAHFAPRCIARLKVMAGLDIAEKRMPRDGRFKLAFNKQHLVNLRISSCPTLFGEKLFCVFSTLLQLN